MKEYKNEDIRPYIMSSLNTPMINYKIYVMNKKEKFETFLFSMILGGILGMIFYGNLFRDINGVKTTASTISNLIVIILSGLFTWKLFYPLRKNMLMSKRKKELINQFRSLLDALAVSLSSGMNIIGAFKTAIKDLEMEYTRDSYIVSEVNEIINGLENNLTIESMLKELGDRSQIEDIKNFGSVFEICNKAGGNMKDVVRRTYNIISEKIEISQEIETAITSNKIQFNAMMLVPVVLVLMMRLMSSSFSAGFASIPGVISITIALMIFLVAYKIGNKIMVIKG